MPLPGEFKNLQFLVVGAGGLGNIIQTTPLVAELAEIGLVDFLVEAKFNDAYLLWKNWDISRFVFNTRADIVKEDYDYIWATDFAKPFKGRMIYSGKNVPTLVHDCRPEWDSYLDFVRNNFGVLRLKPRTHVAVPVIEKENTIILAPGSGPKDKLKRWPHFDQLANELIETNSKIVILGLAYDDTFDWPASVINLCGKLNLYETAQELGRAKLVIANDCGLAHLSRAMGTETAVIFGPTSLTKNLPLGAFPITNEIFCRPCQSKEGHNPASLDCRFNRKCFPTPRQVLKECGFE